MDLMCEMKKEGTTQLAHLVVARGLLWLFEEAMPLALDAARVFASGDVLWNNSGKLFLLADNVLHDADLFSRH